MKSLYHSARNLVPASPIVIDIGCSVGFESLKLFRIYHPSLLISVDPYEENIEKTKELIGVNGDKWKTECCAVDNTTKMQCMVHVVSPHTNNSPCGNVCTMKQFIYSDLNTTKTLKKTKTIIDIHPSANILKVDIEGHEWKIWNQFFHRFYDVIFLELHGGIVPDKEANEKIDKLEEYYNLTWFEYAQSQTKNIDVTYQRNRDIFVNQNTRGCHVLCEYNGKSKNANCINARSNN